MKISKRKIIIGVVFIGVVAITLFLAKKVFKPTLFEYPLSSTNDPGNESNSNSGWAKTNYFCDFETIERIPCKVSSDKAYSGKYCLEMNENTEYSVAFIKKISEVSDGKFSRIAMSCWLQPLQENTNIVLVVSIEDESGNSKYWKGKGTGDQPFYKNEWKKLNAAFNIPESKSKEFKPEDRIKIYVWNKGKNRFLADNIEIVYGEQPERKGDKPVIFIDRSKDSTYIPPQNNYPFPVTYFMKYRLDTNHDAFFAGGKSGRQLSISSNDNVLAGDFYKDEKGLDEIAVVNAKGVTVYGYDANANGFKILWNSTLAGDVAEWNSKTAHISTLGLNEKYGNILKSTDQVMQGNFDDDAAQELLIYNRDWRFELKLAEIKDDKLVIKNTIDFKGYEGEEDPKYYEFTKIVPGNFIVKGQTSLFVISCNCNDQQFDGKRCKELEERKDLPNTAAIFYPIAG